MGMQMDKYYLAGNAVLNLQTDEVVCKCSNVTIALQVVKALNELHRKETGNAFNGNGASGAIK
jgi:hypothetical protein